MTDKRSLAEDLIRFIHNSPTEFHVVQNAAAILEQHGFTRLDSADSWKIEAGGCYYLTVNGSSLTAFTAGTQKTEQSGFRIIAAHTDSPGIKIKPQPDIATGPYIRLNAEIYGSPILNTWLDRPLGLAGRVLTRGKDALHPQSRLIRFNRPLLCIPNLSIHQNKNVNSGTELNRQKDMLPVLGLTDQDLPGGLTALIADKLEVSESEILDCELSVSEYAAGTLTGMNQELISSPKLDDLCMVHAALHSITSQKTAAAARVLCLFDSEETGSRSRQGADSPMLSYILERIMCAAGNSRENYFRALEASFMVSADMCHALHPGSPEKSDPAVQAHINKGMAVKISHSQSYTTNSESAAVWKQICADAGVPCQYFVNRSDQPGGSTAGPLSVSHVPLRCVDTGAPMWAMHSVRETCGVDDHFFAHKVFRHFFAECCG